MCRREIDMKVLLATALYVAVALVPIRWCHSVSEFLVTALGTALLLDRYYFRWLPWTLPIRWPREIVMRVGVLAVGTAGFYVIRFGSVPWWEALTLGTMASLVILLLESMIGGVNRLACGWRAEGRSSLLSNGIGLGVRLVLVGVLVFATPLAAIHPIHTVPRRTPSAQGLGYETVHFTTSDGLNLAGWLVPHPQARGNVIFCHGHGRNRGQGAWLFPMLHEMRLNVLAFDFRGHGDSPGHISTFGHEEVRDLLAAVHYLDTQCPDQPLFIIGVSLGAAVTLQALSELPNVRGVWSEACFSRLSAAMDHYFTAIPEGPRQPLLTAYNYAAWLDCGFWGPDINPKDALAQVRVPIYFCHGRRDELVPFDEAEDLYKSYEGPKWHFWVNEGNHYNLRQVARDEYLERLRSFLEERLTESGAGSTNATVDPG
jgi:alpha-beta hydrolase superfamily lysophospholipase